MKKKLLLSTCILIMSFLILLSAYSFQTKPLQLILREYIDAEHITHIKIRAMQVFFNYEKLLEDKMDIDKFINETIYTLKLRRKLNDVTSWRGDGYEITLINDMNAVVVLIVTDQFVIIYNNIGARSSYHIVEGEIMPYLINLLQA